MNEGTNAVLYLNEEEYELSYYKVSEDKDNYFCYNVDMVFSESFPDIKENESYVARLVVNGDALWYLPWIWFKNKDSKTKAAVHGAIFCPFGLTEEEENKYDSINLIIVSDICYSMTAEVWKNLLLVFSDWLKSKSIPQFQEYINLSNEIEEEEEEVLDDN